MELPDPKDWNNRCMGVERELQRVRLFRDYNMIHGSIQHFAKNVQGAAEWCVEAGLIDSSGDGIDWNPFYGGRFRSALDKSWLSVLGRQELLEIEVKRLKASTRHRAHGMGRHLEQILQEAESTVTCERKLVQLLMELDQQQKAEQEIGREIDDLEAKLRQMDTNCMKWYRQFSVTAGYDYQTKTYRLSGYRSRRLELREDKRRISKQLSELQKEVERERRRQQAEVKQWEELDRELVHREAAYNKPHPYIALSTPMQFRIMKLYSGNFSKAMCVYPSDDQVLPNWPDYFDHLVCSLYTFDLLSGEYPPFEALSYEWNAGQPNAEARRDRTYLLVKDDTDDVVRSIEIGYNLCDAMRHIRHTADDIWIWVDAVCIDQSKREERAHQVKLMGEIYSRAEKVLAWLPVQRPAASLDFLRSLRSNTRNTALDFYATGCEYDTGNLDTGILKSTYWTRKWIIQEIILARTVVLVAGELEFPMQELEENLAKLENAHTSRHDGTIAAVSSWPVAKLATHRRNRRIGMTHPRMLHQLLPLYAENECKEPSDHVYALYNLIGDHRQRLEVDYQQRHSTWFMEVLKFLVRHEHLSKSTLIESSLLLLKMISQPDFFSMGLSSEELAMQVTLSAFDQGTLIHEEECGYSCMLRKHVQSLHPGIRWTFKQSNNLWTVEEKDQSDTERLNTRVLRYFEITGKGVCGLAATRIQQGDRVWQFPNQQLAFIVRIDESDQQVRILGRCYLFNFPDDDSKQQPTSSTLSLDEALDHSERIQCYDLHLSLADMITLGYSGMDIKYIDKPHRARSTRELELRPKRKPVPGRGPADTDSDSNSASVGMS